MKTYLIDSDILIDFFKRKSEAVALLETLAQSNELTISTLSIAELRTGWTEEEANIYLPKLYAIASVQPVTQEIAEIAGSLRQRYGKKGITIPTIDCLIAATAIIHKSCLITRNKKDYPLSELNIY